MELRDAKKKSHIDEVIFVARLPAELIDGDIGDSESNGEENDSNRSPCGNLGRQHCGSRIA